MKSPARQRPYHLQPNLTPLIDVVFLLLVFFLLATQLTREARVEMDLPALHDRESAPPKDSGETRVIVNVLPAEAGATPGYLVNKDVFAEDAPGVEALAAALRRAREADPRVKVLVRAGRVEAYRRVHPVLQAVTLAGVSSVELAAVAPDDEIERLRSLEAASEGGGP